MLQRIVDDTILGGFSLLFRMAVFALKKRHSSVVSLDIRHIEASVEHRPVRAAGRNKADHSFAARSI